MGRTLRTMAWACASALETSAVGILRLRHRWPPLFIVGAPRSGTTAVYLHLLNRFRFAYFPNVAKRYPNACVTAAALGRILYHYEPTYRSRYGIVDGPIAPSDGWDIFHRWFPRYEIDRPVLENRLYALANVVRLFEMLFGAPFANKNNSNSIRIRHLRRTFPDALFIHVRRDVADTVASLIEARAAHGVPLNQWWGVPPPQFLRCTFGCEIEQAVAQVLGVRECVAQSFARIEERRRHVIAYEDFCREASPLETWVSSIYARDGVALGRADCHAPVDLTPSERSGITDRAFRDRVASIVARLERQTGWGP